MHRQQHTLDKHIDALLLPSEEETLSFNTSFQKALSFPSRTLYKVGQLKSALCLSQMLSAYRREAIREHLGYLGQVTQSRSAAGRCWGCKACGAASLPTSTATQKREKKPKRNSQSAADPLD